MAKYRVIGTPERYQVLPGLWYGPEEPLYPGGGNEDLDQMIKAYALKNGLRYDQALTALARAEPQLFAVYRRR